MSGVFALARPPFPHAVHASIAEAARWVAKQNQLLGRQEDWREVERLLQSARELHRSRYP